jgi:rhomboid protease GluP
MYCSKVRSYPNMSDEATPAPLPDPAPYYPQGAPPPPPPYYDPEAVKALEFREGIQRIARQPYVTYAMIAINAAVFILMAIKGVNIMEPANGALIQWGADFGPLTTHGQWWRLLTAAFVHIGIIHIAMNMVVLYMSGVLVERLFGNVGFAVLYLLAGIGGNVVSLAWNPTVVAAGASGAVFGVYGALLGFLVIQRNAIPKATISSLAKSAVTFLMYNLLYGAAKSGIDMGAHIGGFATGFLVGMALSQPLLASHSSRLTRAAMVFVLGLSGLAFCATRIQPADDLSSEAERFGKIENTAVDLYRDTAEKFNAGKVTPQEFSDIVHNKVLPPWNAEIDVFRKMQLRDDDQKLKRGEVVEYMAARGEAWDLRARAILTNDRKLIDQAKAKEMRALAMLDLLKKK